MALPAMLRRAAAASVAFAVAASPARAQVQGFPWAAKVAVYGAHIVPSEKDARDYSRAGWGGGLRGVIAVPQVENILAFELGFEYVNLLSKKVSLTEPVTGLHVDRETSQEFGRIYLGTEIGGHGHGFIRPFAGAAVAVHIYSISTHLVIPDSHDPDRSITQDVSSDAEAAFGYALTLGTDLHYKQGFVEGGVRWLQSFNVPQQLDHAEATQIHPGYFQIFVGLGFSTW